jgi:hypothetical protein
MHHACTRAALWPMYSCIRLGSAACLDPVPAELYSCSLRACMYAKVPNRSPYPVNDPTEAYYGLYYILPETNVAIAMPHLSRPFLGGSDPRVLLGGGTRLGRVEREGQRATAVNGKNNGYERNIQICSNYPQLPLPSLAGPKSYTLPQTAEQRKAGPAGKRVPLGPGCQCRVYAVRCQ